MEYNRIIINLLFICLLLSGCSEEDRIEETDDDSDNISVPAGTVDNSRVMTSAALDRDMHLSVYLPPGYDTSKVSYPVLFLLHGMWGNYLDWVINGMAYIMDDEIYLGKARPMIVVMPDGLDSFYCNNYNNGTLLYEDYMINELLPYAEANFRIKPGGDNRAVAGLSMGGYGAAFHAFKHSNLFSSSYSMSGALSMGTSAPDLQAIISFKTGEELENLPAFTMECGTEDALVYNSNVQFDTFLTGKKIAHSFIRRPGSHDWSFWMACLPKAVEFASTYFPE